MSRSCNGTIAFVPDPEPEMGAIPVYQINIPCGNCSSPDYTLEIKTNDISYYGFNVRSVVETCETIIKEYLRRQRIERNSALYQSLNMLDPRKPFSCGSNISISSSSDEDLLLDHSDKLFESVNQMSFQRSKSTKKMTDGAFLIISPVIGGWNFNTLKNYILKVKKPASVMTTPIRVRTIRDAISEPCFRKKFKSS
ncbi:uncharacterized protein LOC125075952 isoform X2 [Vanessa atalanta]|uniref:uncharacterized protein LOC125075952 isoform X2 n=1 Tax=Vanessa atalanta TaxID=42275 RepID=UPI001FCE28A7|nr:uncharacterized protein LOC125075952 isoform X2 [Vanessa atalanta]